MLTLSKSTYISKRDIAKRMKELSPGTTVKDNIKFQDIYYQALKDMIEITGKPVRLGNILTIKPTVVSKKSAYDGIHKCYSVIPEHTVIKLKKLSFLKEIDNLLMNMVKNKD